MQLKLDPLLFCFLSSAKEVDITGVDLQANNHLSHEPSGANIPAEQPKSTGHFSNQNIMLKCA